MVRFFFFGLLIIVLFSFSCNSEKKERKSTLPRIYISIDEADLNPGDYLVNDFYWLDTNNKTLLEAKSRMKTRGNRSATFPKRSYSVKFSQKKALLGMAESQKWKLNAEYIDKTFMRNKLSYDLFRSFSDENKAPRIAYCAVYLNNRYDGIYALTQSVDADFLNLSKGDGGVLFKEPPVSHPPEEHQNRYEKFKAYINRSIRYKDYSIKAKYKLEDECYFNQRFPDIKELDYTDEIYLITEFIFNTTDKEFSNSAVFDKFFDLQNLIDWHLLILVTANGDGTYKNFYMSRQKEGEPYIFTPWDYDHSFGRDGDGEPSKVQLVPVKKNMALLHRLMETNAFDYRTKLYERFTHLKAEGVLTADNIHKMIDANVELIGDEVEANEKRWPSSEIEYFKNASFQTEVQRMKNWITNHLPELEQHLKEQKEKPSLRRDTTSFDFSLDLSELLETSAVIIEDWLNNEIDTLDVTR